MKTFYRPVDCQSRAAMTDFLENHFRYYTANGYNCAQSYACSMKLYELGFDIETESKLLDMLDTQGFYDARSQLLMGFGERHNFQWQAGMNGRSGGYLVLYQGELKPTGYKSYCLECGQMNFTAVEETGNVCGKCGKPSRRNICGTDMQIHIFPGKGTDDDADFAQWSMEELRERVRLVQDFDRLADDLVQDAVFFAQNYAVQDEEYQVKRTRKVLVPVG